MELKIRVAVWATGRLWVVVLLLVLAVLPSSAQTTQPMAKEAHPSFEVATIKLSDPASQGEEISTEGHRMKLRRETLMTMVMFAYGVNKKQIVGGPAWMAEDRYDIDGVADAAGEPDLEQMQEMLRKLMTERFGLTFHHEQREMAYYSITLAKGGPKLPKSKAAEDIGHPDQTWNSNGKQMDMKFTNNKMSDFALGMQNFVDRPVVDQTGLHGSYDFTLRWLLNDTDATDADGPPMLFTAVEEQLGLKLEPKKGMVDVVAIDRVGRPSAN